MKTKFKRKTKTLSMISISHEVEKVYLPSLYSLPEDGFERIRFLIHGRWYLERQNLWDLWMIKFVILVGGRIFYKNTF